MLYYVDSAGTLAGCQLRVPGGDTQGSGQMDVVRYPILFTKVRGMAGFDQVSWLQVGLGAVAETAANSHRR